MAFSQPARVKYITASVILNRESPFLVDHPIHLESAAGTTVYGAKVPGHAAAYYQKWTQTVTGNKAFRLSSSANAPLQTSGAVTAANQLRTVVLKNGVPVMHTDDSLVAAASSYCIGVGGGTAVGDSTVIVKGTTGANVLVGATDLSVASSGANTKTIKVGDQITNGTNGDATVYTVTESSQTLNGTTEVLLSITPPLQKLAVASDSLTVATSDDRTVLFATAPTVGDTIEAYILAAADVITLTGGALTAGRIYDSICYDFMHSAGACNVTASVG